MSVDRIPLTLLDAHLGLVFWYIFAVYLLYFYFKLRHGYKLSLNLDIIMTIWRSMQQIWMLVIRQRHHALDPRCLRILWLIVIHFHVLFCWIRVNRLIFKNDVFKQIMRFWNTEDTIVFIDLISIPLTFGNQLVDMSVLCIFELPTWPIICLTRYYFFLIILFLISYDISALIHWRPVNDLWNVDCLFT